MNLLYQSERDSFSFQVDAYDMDLDMLVQLEDLGRIHVTAPHAHLADVDEAVFMDPYIHESSEIRNVRDYTWQFHTLFKILDSVDVIRERELLGGLARISAWLGELFEDVLDGREAEVSLDISVSLDLGE